jgi:hypothetical protein
MCLSLSTASTTFTANKKNKTHVPAIAQTQKLMFHLLMIFFGVELNGLLHPLFSLLCINSQDQIDIL